MKSVEQFDVPRHTARIDFNDKAWARSICHLALLFLWYPPMRLWDFESTLNVPGFSRGGRSLKCGVMAKSLRCFCFFWG